MLDKDDIGLTYRCELWQCSSSYAQETARQLMDKSTNVASTILNA